MNIREITHMKVAVSQPANQDLTTILITCYGKNAEGEDVQYYVSNFDWMPYHGFDFLDISRVSFPGWVQVRMTGSIQAHVAGPRADRPD